MRFANGEADKSTQVCRLLRYRMVDQEPLYQSPPLRFPSSENMEDARKTVGQRSFGQTVFHIFLPKLDQIRLKAPFGPPRGQKKIVDAVRRDVGDERSPQEIKHRLSREF